MKSTEGDLSMNGLDVATITLILIGMGFKRFEIHGWDNDCYDYFTCTAWAKSADDIDAWGERLTHVNPATPLPWSVYTEDDRIIYRNG
jgi:hypothetical protein